MKEIKLPLPIQAFNLCERTQRKNVNESEHRTWAACVPDNERTINSIDGSTEQSTHIHNRSTFQHYIVRNNSGIRITKWNYQYSEARFIYSNTAQKRFYVRDSTRTIVSSSSNLFFGLEPLVSPHVPNRLIVLRAFLFAEIHFVRIVLVLHGLLSC